MKTIHLPSYLIIESPLITLNQYLIEKNYSQIWILTDENTQQNCLPLLEEALTLPYQHIAIHSGEIHKNLATCQHIWQALTQAETDRKAVLLNLGGGVIGDMGGFCAATYKRGIDFIQIPTTLLSQVDASVGGKLGIDFQGFKNHIGVFCEPTKVVIEPLFLQTLPFEELRSGFAEVVKHSLIADAAQWNLLQKDWGTVQWENLTVNAHNLKAWHDLIVHSIAIKAKVVAEDPTEKGLRKILNFGHTIGHAVESYLLEQQARRCLHGEAIALGMICESYLARQRGYLSNDDSENITFYLKSIYPRIDLQAKEFEEIARLARQDKKNSEGRIQASLLAKIGKANFDQILTAEDIYESLVSYQKIYQ